jgi:hypothetical protein
VVFGGYDGPLGEIDPSLHVGQWVWTAVPQTAASGGATPCAYAGVHTTRAKVLGVSDGHVVIESGFKPECAYAIAPALIVPDDRSALSPGQPVLFAENNYENNWIVWFARVKATDGDSVTLLISNTAGAGADYGPKAFRVTQALREQVRALPNDIGFGARVLVKNGNSYALANVYGVTGDTLYTGDWPFFKWSRGEVRYFPIGASVVPDMALIASGTDANGGDGLYNVAARRGLDGIVYEVQNKKGKRWTVGFEAVAPAAGVGRLP